MKKQIFYEMFYLQFQGLQMGTNIIKSTTVERNAKKLYVIFDTEWFKSNIIKLVLPMKSPISLKKKIYEIVLL